MRSVHYINHINTDNVRKQNRISQLKIERRALKSTNHLKLNFQ